LGAKSVNELSSVLALSGRIHVLNCCDGNSSRNRLTHFCHTGSANEHPLKLGLTPGLSKKLIKDDGFYGPANKPGVWQDDTADSASYPHPIAKNGNYFSPFISIG
jgi:hypothetical protein